MHKFRSKIIKENKQRPKKNRGEGTAAGFLSLDPATRYTRI